MRERPSEQAIDFTLDADAALDQAMISEALPAPSNVLFKVIKDGEAIDCSEHERCMFATFKLRGKDKGKWTAWLVDVAKRGPFLRMRFDERSFIGICMRWNGEAPKGWLFT